VTEAGFGLESFAFALSGAESGVSLQFDRVEAAADEAQAHGFSNRVGPALMFAFQKF
jgi:hypothetical protein